MHDAPKMMPLPDDSELYTIDEWIAAVCSNVLTNDDGDGEWATVTQRPDYSTRREWYIWPSDYTKPNFAPPAWATHVVWYSK